MKRFLLVIVACLGWYSQADAAISYRLVTDQPSYTLTTPGSVVVNLYLQETTTGSSTSFLADMTANGGQGLAGFGLLVTRSSGSATLGAAVKNTTDFNGNFAVNPNGPTQVGIQGDGGVAPGATGVTNSLGNGNGRTVLLASINIAATSGISAFVLNDFKNFQAIANDTLAFKNLDLFANANQDGFAQGQSVDWAGTISNGNFQFTVEVQPAEVPEPSSLALCGLAFGGMAYGAYRRRKSKAAVNADVSEPAVLA